MGGRDDDRDGRGASSEGPDGEDGYANWHPVHGDAGQDLDPRLTDLERLTLGTQRRLRLDLDARGRHEAYLGARRTPEGRTLRAELTAARRLPTMAERRTLCRDLGDDLQDAWMSATAAVSSAPPVALALWLHELCWRLVETAHGSYRRDGMPRGVIAEVLTRQLASLEAARHASSTWAMPSVLRHLGVDAHAGLSLAVGRLELLHGQLALSFGEEAWPVDTLIMLEVAHSAVRNRWHDRIRARPDPAVLGQRLRDEVAGTVDCSCAITHAVERSFMVELDARVGTHG